MAEVVFLSNTNIQVASGKAAGNGVKVSKLFSAPLPEGAVLNGVVMDQDMVTTTIKSLWHENKLPKSEVTLIINSPQLRANHVDAPIQSDKKTTEYIRRETADSDYGRFQKPSTGWYLVSKDNKTKTQKVIYETAETEFVNKYVDIFEKAGLKLKAIHNGVQLATEFFAKASVRKTVIYMILDGKSLVTIFFAEGKYYYDSTSRVFAEPGTPEFAREIYASISSIRQFMSAQRLEVTVKDILFAGLTQPQMTSLSNDILNIDSQIDISVVQPPSGTSISGGAVGFPFYIYPIAGLRKIDEKLSILKASKQTEIKAADKSGLRKLIVPAIVVFGILGLAYAGLTILNGNKKAELKKIQDYNNSPEVISQIAEYEEMYRNMSEIGGIQGGADLLNDYIASYPVPDSSINRRILTAAAMHDVDVTFKSYSSSTGIFNITASSPEVDDINMFISDLMEMDIFEDVDYTGYVLRSDGSAWEINVVCILAPGEPSEAAEEVN